MTYFISDLHFGHANILKLCERPFETVEEMDRALIARWNKAVHKNDTVYILGDIIWHKRLVPYYMEQLKGEKILLPGNHDAGWVKDKSLRRYFAEVTPYIETHICSHPVTLCHYPLLEWQGDRKEGSSKLGYLIHGHIHNRKDALYRPLFCRENALNAGVDINDFTPVSFDTLRRNNLAFKLSVLTDEADRAALLESAAENGLL